jgi:hypothetical protein
MKTTVAALAAFATLLLTGSGGAESHRAAVGLTPAKTEQFLVQRRISFDTPGGITVGPTLAAACRGEWPSRGLRVERHLLPIHLRRQSSQREASGGRADRPPEASGRADRLRLPRLALRTELRGDD